MIDPDVEWHMKKYGRSLEWSTAIVNAARVWAAGCARQAALTPREAAEEAYVPGGPSVDELEGRIRRRREQWAAEEAQRDST